MRMNFDDDKYKLARMASESEPKTTIDARFRTPRETRNKSSLALDSVKGTSPSERESDGRASFQKPIYATTQKRPRRSMRREGEGEHLHFDASSCLERASGRSSNLTGSKLSSEKLKNPGLKIISMQVMRAVQNNKYTTYKEVAIYVSSLNENNPSLLDYGEENDASKRQEKNLRRRVYDSLNVLYAVGVLKKQDKKVYCNYPELCNWDLLPDCHQSSHEKALKDSNSECGDDILSTGEAENSREEAERRQEERV